MGDARITDARRQRWDDFDDPLMASWLRHLRAGRQSEETVRTYADSARALIEFTGASSVADITRRDIETVMASMHAQYKPSTMSVRYRAWQQLFK